ncbi:MAG TPA: diaminopimelate epimerase [Polyangiaceae bacterium]|nr:diaminopimelate epimerase [Polyangiaceae bacterium]
MTLHFEKWQGLGNDFVVVDQLVTPERARTICDRRFGVGGDGVLCVEGIGGQARMTVLNADGSRPEMCGNGLRCVVGHLADARDIAEGELVVATDAGDKRCWFRRKGDGYEVSVAMGRPGLGEELRFEHEGRTWSFATIDMGNPHAVSFDAHQCGDLDGVGPALERARPGGVNVELCRIVDGAIAVIVWERGVGRTLACGTGACAVAAAACAAELVPYDEPVDVLLPGGPLRITVASADRTVTMVGPAARVFTGETVL